MEKSPAWSGKVHQRARRRKKPHRIAVLRFGAFALAAATEQI
jgi:hypothetical protein